MSNSFRSGELVQGSRSEAATMGEDYLSVVWMFHWLPAFE